jgi:Putative zinc-finger
MHPHESLIRTHVEGEGSERERQEVDEHLKGCSDCREFLSFAQDFSETAKALAEDEIAADEPHASKSVIIAYEEGKLDAETALHLRAHMLFCDQCAETYYLLKRMHAPSWTDVVIEAARSAKETLLQVVEITGMGELVLAPSAGVSRSIEPEQPQPTVEIIQHVTDSGDEAELHLYVESSAKGPGTTVRILVAIDSPKPAWKAKLLDTEDNELASVPLTERRQVLHSGVTPGALVVQVLKKKDDEVLAECRLMIQAAHEPASAHGDR